MKKVELLIPVGNEECLHAAIHNGADAVYLGGKKFGARAYSNNFDNDQMIKAIKECHLYGVKIYVTVNTMIYNEEIEEVIEYLNFLYENNVDAVIMQDIGLIELTRKTIPNLEIHVSTQAHNHNESGIDYFKKIGCTRVVFDRESSLEEITSIKTDIEKEIFVYGALCICYSGNCLMSALNGGRSANRGMCVGSCRLPYTLYKNDVKKDSGYLLSTKDLNTLEYLEEILKSNIDSLKIEGRMKSKEYVAVVTKTYRKLIDAFYNSEKMQITEEEKKNLLKTFNRGFTKGFLFNAQNIINSETSNHQGIKIGTVIKANNKKITIKLDENIHQGDAIRFSKCNNGMFVNSLYNQKGLLVSEVTKNNICEIDNKDRLMIKDLEGSSVLKTIDYILNEELNKIPEKKIEINMEFSAKENQTMTLTIYDGTNKLSENSTQIIEKAKTSPTDKERIRTQLSKLGNTPYICQNIILDVDENIFINIKELNELRRNLIEKLTQKREGSKKTNIIEYKNQISISESKPKISILTRNEDQLKIALKNNIDIIYTTDKNLYQKYQSNKNIYLRLERVNIKHEEHQNDRLLCTELGSITKYSQNNTVRSDYYLNIANDYSIDALKKLQTESITLSIENNINELNNIKNKKNSEIIVYGTPECMIIKNNILDINNEKTYLKDPKNNKFTVIYENNFTHIYNHEKINLINNIKHLKGFGTYRLELLDEDATTVQKLINDLKNMLY